MAAARRQVFRMPGKPKSSKPTACQACQSGELLRRITTYPVYLTGQLEGKQSTSDEWHYTNASDAATSCRRPPDRPKWTATLIWESGCSSANCTEIP
jgi:hypothetical protein